MNIIIIFSSELIEYLSRKIPPLVLINLKLQVFVKKNCKNISVDLLP